MWAAQSKFNSEAKSDKGQENRCKIIQSLVKAGANINITNSVSSTVHWFIPLSVHILMHFYRLDGHH